MPITPGATGASFDVLLAFSLDPEANKRVQAGVSTMEQELKRLQDEAGKTGQSINKVGEQAAEAAVESSKKVALTWTQFIKGKMGPEMKAAMAAGLSHSEAHKVAIGKIAEEWKKYKAEGIAALKGVETQEEKVSDEVEKVGKSSAQFRAEAQVLLREASVLTDGVKSSQIAALRNVSGLIGGIAQTATIAGAAITGGIFAEVSNYVSNAKEATAVTEAWRRETDAIGKSRTRIDEVLAKEALPLLKEAAKVSNEAAGFVEKHPEIVSAALKTGVVLAGLGAVGLAVSKGIKLVADIQYLSTIPAQLTAAKLQDMAADKQLAAATLRVKELAKEAIEKKIPITNRADDLRKAFGLDKPDKPSPMPSILSPIPLLSILAGGAAYSALGRGAANFGAKAFGFASPEKFWQDLIGKVGESIPWVKKFGDAIFGLGDKAQDAAKDISQAATQLAGSSHESEIVSAFTKWKEDDRRLVSEAAANRKKIIEEGEAEIANITKRYTDQRVSINAQFNDRRSEIIRDFNAENQKAEQDYQQARIDAKKGEAEQLQKIAEDHQERLRQIEKDGAERLGELAASRDALGLSKEQDRIAEQIAEENRSTKRAAEQVRKETEARLAELANQYALEQAQRQQQFIQKLAENEQQRQAELKQAAEENQAALKQAREAQAAKLRDLQEGLNAERLRRREVFIAEVRDLDASLLGERNLKSKYYTLMLQDAEAWLARYRAALAGGSSSPIPSTGAPFHDYTGYAYSGLYRMAGDGKKQFVLGGDATRAAENIVGGTLSQDNLLRLLSMGGAQSVNYNDYRRMDGPTSKDERALFQRAAEAAILTALGR